MPDMQIYALGAIVLFPLQLPKGHRMFLSWKWPKPPLPPSQPFSHVHLFIFPIFLSPSYFFSDLSLLALWTHF